jgi:GNAT acetyltransferase-like protein
MSATLLAPAGVRTRVVRDIREVEPAEWDSFLAPDDLQASHRFVEVCQTSGIEQAGYRHVLVYRDGRLEAVASLSMMRVALDLLAPRVVRDPAGLIRRRWSRFLRVPVLFAGLPVSFGQSCFRIRPGARAGLAVGAVAEVMEDTARDLGARILCWKEFTTGEASALSALPQFGYFPAASLPGCALPIRWGSFADYLAGLRAGYRRQALAALRARSLSGLSIRVADDPAAACDLLYPLYEQVMARARHRLEQLGPEFFRQLVQRFPTETRLLLAERDGRVLGAALLLRAGATTTFMLTGLDYAEHQRHQVYPNLLLDIVADTIRAGSTRLELGQTSYDLKGRMGGITSPRLIYLRHCGRTVHRALRIAGPVLFPDTAVRTRRVFRQHVGE